MRIIDKKTGQGILLLYKCKKRGNRFETAYTVNEEL